MKEVRQRRVVDNDSLASEGGGGRLWGSEEQRQRASEHSKAEGTDAWNAHRLKACTYLGKVAAKQAEVLHVVTLVVRARLAEKPVADHTGVQSRGASWDGGEVEVEVD